VNTCNTAAQVHSVRRCVKIQHCPHLSNPFWEIPQVLPVPVLHPTLITTKYVWQRRSCNSHCEDEGLLIVTYNTWAVTSMTGLFACLLLHLNASVLELHILWLTWQLLFCRSWNITSRTNMESSPTKNLLPWWHIKLVTDISMSIEPVSHSATKLQQSLATGSQDVGQKGGSTEGKGPMSEEEAKRGETARRKTRRKARRRLTRQLLWIR